MWIWAWLGFIWSFSSHVKMVAKMWENLIAMVLSMLVFWVWLFQLYNHHLWIFLNFSLRNAIDFCFELLLNPRFSSLWAYFLILVTYSSVLPNNRIIGDIFFFETMNVWKFLCSNFTLIWLSISYATATSVNYLWAFSVLVRYLSYIVIYRFSVWLLLSLSLLTFLLFFIFLPSLSLWKLRESSLCPSCFEISL
jgi:hypothetical protein